MQPNQTRLSFIGVVGILSGGALSFLKKLTNFLGVPLKRRSKTTNVHPSLPRLAKMS